MAMQNMTKGEAKVESEYTHLFYDKKTGLIVHAHTTVTMAGGSARSLDDEASRAREVAASLGHDMNKLEIMRADRVDGSMAQRVDVKTRQLVAHELKKKTAKAKGAGGKKKRKR